MTASSAPAAMPSVEDVALAIKRAQLGGRAELSKEGPWREHEFKPARAILDLFAPILAEKEREIAWLLGDGGAGLGGRIGRQKHRN